MKKFIFALRLLFTGISAQASDYESILVTMIDGSNTTICIDEKPIVSINESNIIIKTTMTTIEIDRFKVVRFNFIEEATSGVNVLGNVQQTQVKYSDGLFIFRDLAPDSEIKVYNLDGILLREETATGNYILSAAELAAGVYIVTINGISTKIAITR